MFNWWGSSKGTEAETDVSKEGQSENTESSEGSASHKDTTETAKELAKNLGSKYCTKENTFTKSSW